MKILNLGVYGWLLIDASHGIQAFVADIYSPVVLLLNNQFV